jgi:hypothetical protein
MELISDNLSLNSLFLKLNSLNKATMLKKSKLKIKRRNTEPSVCMGAGNSRNVNDNVYQDGDSEPF